LKPRILAIDDEETTWLENFKAWIPEDIAIQDSAATTSQAIELLRKYRYHVVLLDLSMDVNNPFNRENRAIQEYLATQPEGTLYIVVSGTAEKLEVRDAALRLGAWDVIFKAEIEPAMLRDKVIRAIEEASKQENQFVIEAKRKLISPNLESQILKVLDPKEGAGGMYQMMDTLFHRIVPVAVHKNRPGFEVWNNCVVGLVWSRYIGKAISIALAGKSVPEDEAARLLRDWLGYTSQDHPIFNRESHRVRIQLFEEPSISNEHFDLPVVPATGI
jgi:DNA-binding NarL/FixJ family response regulator